MLPYNIYMSEKPKKLTLIKNSKKCRCGKCRKCKLRISEHGHKICDIQEGSPQIHHECHCGKCDECKLKVHEQGNSLCNVQEGSPEIHGCHCGKCDECKLKVHEQGHKLCDDSESDDQPRSLKGKCDKCKLHLHEEGHALCNVVEGSPKIHNECNCGKCDECKLKVHEQGHKLCCDKEKPQKSNDCKCKKECETPCCEKIGIILIDFKDGTIKNEVTVLRRASRKWQVKAIEFRFLDVADGTDQTSVDTAVNLVESYVDELKLKGFKRFILPSQSTVLAPFLLGTGGSLGGVPFHIRHPDVIAAVYNPGTPVVDQIPNVWRFTDVFSDSDGALTIGCIASFLEPGGKILILHQQGDLVSDFYTDLYTNYVVPNLPGPPAIIDIPIPFNGTNFNFTGVLVAIQNLPTGSIVVHIANGSYGAIWSTDGTSAGIFIASSTNGPITHFGGNYAPNQVSVPVVIELGCGAGQAPGASCDAVELGYSSNWDDFIGAVDLWYIGTGYYQAFAWLATCGQYCGDDNRLKFSRGGTLIGMFVFDQSFPANSTIVEISQIRINPRWIDQDDPLTMF